MMQIVKNLMTPLENPKKVTIQVIQIHHLLKTENLCKKEAKKIER